MSALARFASEQPACVALESWAESTTIVREDRLVAVFPEARSLVAVADAATGADLTLARISEDDRRIHAFVPESDRVRRVKDAAEGAPAGALHGVMVGIKDIVRVDGFETRAGSRLPPEVLGGRQAEVVDILAAAGALIAGKTVTAEFALAAPGPTRNPRDLTRTPGGSSSGSAAAVASGMVPLAVGTQTVGSVIRPAAFCGVVGFRPTWGAISTAGIIANAPSLDTVGVFTADVASAAIAAAVLCGWTEAPAEKRQPILGIPDGDYLDAADRDGRAEFLRHVGAFRNAGYEVRSASLTTGMRPLQENLATVQRFEFADGHAEWFRRYAPRYARSTAEAIHEGRSVTPADYEAARRWKEHFSTDLRTSMGDAGIDIWITPSAPGAPPRGLASTGNAVMSTPFSFAGMPAISLPTTNRAGVLPYGVQCVAAQGEDQYLLASAAGLEIAIRS